MHMCIFKEFMRSKLKLLSFVIIFLFMHVIVGRACPHITHGVASTIVENRPIDIDYDIIASIQVVEVFPTSEDQLEWFKLLESEHGYRMLSSGFAKAKVIKIIKGAKLETEIILFSRHNTCSSARRSLYLNQHGYVAGYYVNSKEFVDSILADENLGFLKFGWDREYLLAKLEKKKVLVLDGWYGVESEFQKIGLTKALFKNNFAKYAGKLGSINFDPSF